MKMDGGGPFGNPAYAQALRVASVTLLLVLVGAGCGSSRPSADPGAFATRITRLILANRYAEAWRDLHPTDQAVAPLAEYQGCEIRSPIVLKPTSVEALSVTSESVGLGNGRFVSSEAVHVRIAFGAQHVVHTVHLVALGGKWKWVLPSWRFRDYRADKCPAATSAVPTSA